jgi:hypothetical protein
MRKICPRCKGRGYRSLTENWSISTIGHWPLPFTSYGPLPMKCWRCEGRGWIEVWDGYAKEAHDA